MNPQKVLPSAPRRRPQKSGSVHQTAVHHAPEKQKTDRRAGQRPVPSVVSEGDARAIRELEPIPVASGHSEQTRREARYRYILLLADALAWAVGVIVAASLGKATHLTVLSVLLLPLAPVLAKILGLYDRDQARIRKSTLDELPALLQLAALLSFLALALSPLVFGGSRA